MTLRMMEIYILEALAIFQYLSAQQLLRLLPVNGIASVNRYLRALRNAETHLIKQINF